MKPQERRRSPSTTRKRSESPEPPRKKDRRDSTEGKAKRHSPKREHVSRIDKYSPHNTSRNKSPEIQKNQRKSLTPEKRRYSPELPKKSKRVEARYRSKSRTRSPEIINTSPPRNRNRRSKSPEVGRFKKKDKTPERSITKSPKRKGSTPEIPFKNRAPSECDSTQEAGKKKRNDSVSSTDSEKRSKIRKAEQDSKRNVKPQPVVRLRSSSEDERSDSDNDKVDEEKERELRMLRLLKSGLAAKAKEALEKKSREQRDSKTPEIPNVLKKLKDRSGSPKHQDKNQIEPDVFDIRIMPINKDNEIKKLADDAAKRSLEESKTNVEMTLKSLRNSKSASSSRSRSRSRSGERSRSSSKSSYRCV